MNISYNLIDRHVENGLGDSPAFHYESAYTGDKLTYTFKQYHEQVSKFARVLVNNGVQKGDRVMIYMPMIPEA